MAKKDLKTEILKEATAYGSEVAEKINRAILRKVKELYVATYPSIDVKSTDLSEDSEYAQIASMISEAFLEGFFYAFIAPRR